MLMKLGSFCNLNDFLFYFLENKKTLISNLRLGFLNIKKLGSDLLSHAKSILSLAISRFTVLFGMGRSGSNSLCPPSKLVNLLININKLNSDKI